MLVTLAHARLVTAEAGVVSDVHVRYCFKGPAVGDGGPLGLPGRQTPPPQPSDAVAIISGRGGGKQGRRTLSLTGHKA